MPQDQSLVVVAPFFNEAENSDNILNCLVESPGPILEGVVDDGSTDQTAALIQRPIENSPICIRLARLSRNFGRHSALKAGCEQACRLAGPGGRRRGNARARPRQHADRAG